MFRVKNTNNNIKYYTVVVGNDSIHENPTQIPLMRLRRPPSTNVVIRPTEVFVYDNTTQEWSSETRY
jgi:hypothetical protein